MKHSMTRTDVDVYPVGALDDILFTWSTLLRARGHWREALNKLLRNLSINWKRRNYWNGYLAEPGLDSPEWRRAGHGWTKSRALRDLNRHIDKLARSSPDDRIYR